MADFTNAELIDMILIYGEAMQNVAAARELYRVRFPNRRLPNAQTFINTIQRGRETGNLRPNRGLEGGRQRHNREADVIDLVTNNPNFSTRQISAITNISQPTVWRILNEGGLHPYHYQRVQCLQPEDHPRRVQFCEWLIDQNNQNPNFALNILCTDESSFHRNSIFNRHNTHYWSRDNPHKIQQTHFQQQFSVNVWVGIVHNTLVGPVYLPARLDGEAYLHFLRNDLENILDNIPLAVRQQMWFLHDGAPPHYAAQVREYLNQEFRGRWIGRGGPVLWPPRSPDINPIDFFFWGDLKNKVYDVNVNINSAHQLRLRINEAADTIRNYDGQVYNRVTQNWLRRAHLCIQQNGGHFEHLL